MARANIAWADVVDIWSATRLANTASDLHTGRGRHPRTATCALRGIQAIADTIVRGLEG